MKTPEEIKKGLECCLASREYRNCLTCPYGTPKKRGVAPCDCEVKQDVFAYIQQLERERDAAVKDIYRACDTCKHSMSNNKTGVPCTFRLDCHMRGAWQWRGVQEVGT